MNKLFQDKVDSLNKNIEKWYDHKIAIYGTGEHTKWLLNAIPINKFEQIYLLDNSPISINKSKFGFQVYDINDIKSEIKAIIISSQSYEIEIYNRIEYLKREGIDIICMYLDIDMIKRDKAECKDKGFSINLGAGNWHKANWRNVDFYANELFVDYKINLLKEQKLPIKNNVVNKVFTSHLIEHLSDQDICSLLQEVYRVMMKDSILRIACPDADLAFKAYEKDDMNFFCLSNEVFLVGDSIERRLVNFFASYVKGDYCGGPIVEDNEVREKLKSLNKDEFIKWCRSKIPKDAEYVAHINGHYFEKLQCILRKIGFVNIKKSSFRKSNDLELRGEEFDNRAQQSLYVECYK